MCMKYVNANVQCFDDKKVGFWGDTDFSNIISTVKSTETKEGCVIGGFNIITFINIRGTQKGNNPENPVDMRKKLSFRIRLTKLDSQPENQLSYDLGDFELDLGDDKIRKTACFDYIEQIHVLELKDTVLKSNGSYVIKVLVKESNANLFDIQITHPLYVE